MNYKTYALVSMLITSLILVNLIAGLPSVQSKLLTLKTTSKLQYTVLNNVAAKGIDIAIKRSSEDNKVDTIFHFVSTNTTTSTNNGNKTYGVRIGDKTFPITYQITGSGNKLSNITAAKDNTTLLVNVGGSKANGNLTIQLPRNLIDSKKQGNQDSPYVIFEDSQPSQRIQEIKSNAQARTLVIDFDKGTNIIEIAGSVIQPASTYLGPAANKSTSATIQNATAKPNSGVNSTATLKFAGKTFPITYQITGSGNKLSNITAAKDNTTLLVNVGGSKANGNLTIQLPRNLIDSKKQGNQDSPYVIFEDSQPSQRIQEIKSNAQARTLVIDFDKGTNIIEIAGSKMLPEFGPASAVVLAIAIMGIIMVSMRYKHTRLRLP